MTFIPPVLCHEYSTAKFTFETKLLAKRRLDKFRRKLERLDKPGNRGQRGEHLDVFHCPHCDKWHIGTKPSDIKRLRNNRKKAKLRENRRERKAEAIEAGPEFLTVDEAEAAAMCPVGSIPLAIHAGILRRYPGGIHNIALAAWVREGSRI